MPKKTWKACHLTDLFFCLGSRVIASQQHKWTEAVTEVSEICTV